MPSITGPYDPRLDSMQRPPTWRIPLGGLRRQA